MKSHKTETLIVAILTCIIVLVLMTEQEPINPYFIALTVAAMILLRVTLMLARGVPEPQERMLNHDLRMNLLDHRFFRPAFSVDPVQSFGSGSYPETDYQPQFAVMISSQHQSDSLTSSKYN